MPESLPRWSPEGVGELGQIRSSVGRRVDEILASVSLRMPDSYGLECSESQVFLEGALK